MLPKSLVVLLLLSCCTATSEPMSMEQWNQSDLSFGNYLQMKSPNYWLGHQSFLALKRAAFTAKVKGTILFIPDWSQHAASPKYLNLLRKEFNDYGWGHFSYSCARCSF